MQLAFGERPALARVDRRAARRLRRPRRAQLPLEPGRERHLLSGDDDVRRRAGAAQHARRSPREWEPKLLAPAYDPRPLPVSSKTAATVGMAMTEKQGGSDLRANQTRARRVVRRPLRAARPQVVLLGADVRRLPHARAARRRAHLLLRAALAPRRHAQPLLHPAPEGEGRQPLERLERDRVRRHARVARRRAGARHRDADRDGAPHALRHRRRGGGDDARGASTRRCTRASIASRSAAGSPSSR